MIRFRFRGEDVASDVYAVSTDGLALEAWTPDGRLLLCPWEEILTPAGDAGLMLAVPRSGKWPKEAGVEPPLRNRSRRPVEPVHAERGRGSLADAQRAEGGGQVLRRAAWTRSSSTAAAWSRDSTGRQ
jgi:hypothetical protein